MHSHRALSMVLVAMVLAGSAPLCYPGDPVALTIGVTDPGAYGHNYGTNQHQTELIATFESPGTDLDFFVTGYDIDFADEVSVTLNGTPLGNLSQGPNNGLNAGDTFRLFASQQVAA